MAISIRADCKHFLGDRPCVPHKTTGVHCPGCTHYQTIQTRILIIKLDALGDVLRTTCILDALHQAHPGACIEWLTREGASDLFVGNPLVHRVHLFPGNAWVVLQTHRFDLVINLDNAPLSAQLATLAQGARKIGYGFHPDGYIFPFNDEAIEWLEMGLFDDLKLANCKTYQQIALEICALPAGPAMMHLYLDANERAWALERSREWGIRPGTQIIGLNTGASARWPHKKWTEDGFVELIGLIRNAGQAGRQPAILLLGGRDEAERNARIVQRCSGAAIHCGAHFSLRQFFALVDLCDLVVTGDTLALHVAAALNKYVVAIFGPTSTAEIELYGRGVKLVSDAPCVGTYRTTCDVQPDCMQRIKACQVHAAVVDLMGCDEKPEPEPEPETSLVADDSASQCHDAAPSLPMFGLNFTQVTLDGAVELIIQASRSRSASLVVTPNVDQIVRFERDQSMHSVYKDAKLCFADGMPIVWLSRLLDLKGLPERITGVDLMPLVCEAAAHLGHSVFLMGGNAGVADAASARLRQRYPGLKVAGVACPPFGFEHDPAESLRLVEEINRSGAEILFLGVGAPKQEKWASHYLDRLKVGPILCVGAAFAFAAGYVRRAPLCIQSCGLEWLWRLMQEPRRLWRRYLVDDMRFLLIAPREYAAAKRRRVF